MKINRQRQLGLKVKRDAEQVKLPPPEAVALFALEGDVSPTTPARAVE